MYLLVIPFGKTFDEIGYTYSVPDFLQEELKLGQIIEIPFGDKLEYGIGYKIITDIGNIDKTKIKPIVSIVNSKELISGYRLDILEYIAKNYFTPIHNSLNLFLPKNLKEKAIKFTLEKEKLSTYNYKNNISFDLSSKQKDIYNEIFSSNDNKFLLHGVTGSGKTEIYIKLIEDYINKGQQVLILIPEIILSNQISTRLKDVFGDDIIILNSTVTEAKKTKYFLDIESGNAKIIIGTRSSLFYPYNNLGLIIIDEEHDNSYISDQSPRYNSIEIANKITDINKNKLLLASGTPSVNSMYKAINKEYKLLTLLEKFTK